LCIAGNVLVQVSPYPMVKQWALQKCTGEADAAPYVSIAFGGWQWCYYGVFAWMVTQRSGFLILVQSNVLGALLGTYYTVAFYKYCRNEENTNSLQRYLSAVASLVLIQVCAFAVLPAERALFLTGLVSSFCSFVGAISMMVTIPTVVRTQDARSIPGPLVTACFFSAGVWCLCGWILQDPLIMCPNIVSTLACATCLYLKARFPAVEKSAGVDNVIVNPSKFECKKVDELTTLTAKEQELSGTPYETFNPQFGDGTGGTC